MSGGNRREEVQAYFEDLWRRDGAGWAGLDGTEWRTTYERELAMLEGRRYPRALELGCGAGQFTARLAPLAGHLVAVDISPTAVDLARQRVAGVGQVEFRVADAMDFDLSEDGPWDLVVMNDAIYYLGSVRTFLEVAWLAAMIFAATAPGGRCMLANASSAAEGDNEDMRPWVIRTYRDLFLNVGYVLEQEAAFPITYAGCEWDLLISLFAKPQPTQRPGSQA